MFELYTEKARRTIFFARYEASQLGSPDIETEHLLLGVLREDKRLRHLLPRQDFGAIHQKVEALSPKRERVSTSIDLPLSHGSKRVLGYAAQEAERLTHKHIGTEHLFLGLMREEEGMAAAILQEFGVTLANAREQITALPPDTPPSGRSGAPDSEAIQLHGASWNARQILSVVSRYLRTPWLWRQEVWQPKDLVESIATGEISFNLTLADDAANYKLVKN